MDDNNTTTNSTYEGWQSQQTPPSFWTNLTLPVLYVVIVVGSLYAFSSLYRKRQAAQTAQLESWFPAHRARDVYLTLLHREEKEGQEDEKTTDARLKAALLRRAVEDIRRILQLRGCKDALKRLVQRGSVGEALWTRFERAEQEMEVEVRDVVSEANAFSDGWGQVIFQSAHEMYQNKLVREQTEAIQERMGEEKRRWEGQRERVRQEFLQELEGPSATTTKAPRKPGISDDEGVWVDTGETTTTGTVKKRKGKK